MAKVRLLIGYLTGIVAAIGLTTIATAQVKVDKPGVPTPDPNASGSDVVLLVRTKDFRSPVDIKRDILVAATRVNAKFDKGSFNMEPIDYSTWKKFASILGGFKLGAEEEVSFGKGGVRISQTGYRNQFVLQVPPSPDLESINLEYSKPAPTDKDPDAVKKDVIELKPGVREDEPEKMPLRRRGIGGQFNLTLPSDWVPISMKVKMKGEPESSEPLEWPQETLFLGRLNNFEGDLPKLFEAMGSRECLGVPIQGLHETQSLSIVMADFVRPFATPEVGWEARDTFFVKVPYDPSLPANRVWFLFPMTQNEMDNAEKQLKSFPVSEYRFAEQLRSSQNPFLSIMPEDGKKIIATESSPPQWLVLPLVVGDKGEKSYYREYKVDNPDAYRKRYVNEAKALYLYEFDTTEGPKILPLAGEGGGKGTRMYTTQEVPRWARGLSDAK